MVDIATAVLQPIPDGSSSAFFTAAVDPFVAARVYDLAPTKTVFAPTPDIEAPTIVNFDPPLGTILQATEAVSFDVLDNSGAFARIIVGVRFTDGVEEIIHDGDSFTGFYALQSSRTVVSTGFRYSVLRQGGWPTAPTFRIFPIDASGNDGT